MRRNRKDADPGITELEDVKKRLIDKGLIISTSVDILFTHMIIVEGTS
jgi:hypothetical protein